MSTSALGTRVAREPAEQLCLTADSTIAEALRRDQWREGSSWPCISVWPWDVRPAEPPGQRRLHVGGRAGAGPTGPQPGRRRVPTLRGLGRAAVGPADAPAVALGGLRGLRGLRAARPGRGAAGLGGLRVLDDLLVRPVGLRQHPGLAVHVRSYPVLDPGRHPRPARDLPRRARHQEGRPGQIGRKHGSPEGQSAISYDLAHRSSPVGPREPREGRTKAAAALAMEYRAYCPVQVCRHTGPRLGAEAWGAGEARGTAFFDGKHLVFFL